MADDDLIDAYLDQVRGLLSGYRHRDRVVQEIEDHLRDEVHALVVTGHDEPEATAMAVGSLGDPSTYTGSFAGSSAMPTTFTRWSGLAGLLGLGVSAMALVHAGRLKAEAPADAVDPFSWLLLPALALLLIGLLGVVLRTRGAYGAVRATTAAVLVGVGGSVGMVAGYDLVGIVCAGSVLAGLALLMHTAYRVGALPRPATIMIALSGIGLSILAGTSIEKQRAPFYVGFATLLIGWCWLQYTLWSERPSRNRAA